MYKQALRANLSVIFIAILPASFLSLLGFGCYYLTSLFTNLFANAWLMLIVNSVFIVVVFLFVLAVYKSIIKQKSTALINLL